MGTTLSSWLFMRRRPRDSSDDGDEEASTSPEDSCASRTQDADGAAYFADHFPSPLSRHLCSLRYRRTSADKVNSIVCRYVAEDMTTQQTYGCHAHLYETASPDESHGAALAWCVEEGAPISALSLLSLCRVANSCRKKTLLTSLHGEALILTYTATLT
ncbi:hypothetical protein ABL78_6147 [Leptomonas seymouri]|uniref:Uncharacterized protein n=1 Tax=Leptomonas seymouri TaxID=5684 RepID=A0A0N0P4G2_LEPSE|nr:hypothetical protein ABL78_6147 [Leptomonas seymouri]|eukprot:KPI84797.1 hypothetical protein ABL78_6147 [Leptomonas seymouri]